MVVENGMERAETTGMGLIEALKKGVEEFGRVTLKVVVPFGPGR